VAVDAEPASGNVDHAAAGFARLVEQALEKWRVISLPVPFAAGLNDVPSGRLAEHRLGGQQAGQQRRVSGSCQVVCSWKFNGMGKKKNRFLGGGKG